SREGYKSINQEYNHLIFSKVEHNKQQLFSQLKDLDTEQRNANTRGIDLADSLEIARLINAEDQKVALEVQKKLPAIAEAIDLVKQAFDEGGQIGRASCRERSKRADRRGTVAES